MVLTPVLTIKIPPKSMIKWGKTSSHVLNFVYNSPSSTSTCRIICMQDLWQNLCKMVKKIDKGGKWTWQGALGPLGHIGWPHHGSARRARWPCHVTDPWEHKPSQALILNQFAPRVWMECPWIVKTTVIHLEASNRPPNQLTCQIFACADFTTTIGSQPVLWDQKAVEWRASRHTLGAAQCPRHPNWPPSYLQIPPLPLHTIKGGVELSGEVPHSFPSSLA
jgi:hypothetical protein